ncbi:MAG: rlmJ [Bacteroidetes bacterium]|nr:rlmJ [Bacteroidota bacterium]
MPYIHYGQIGDIWKHLPLCSILRIEEPTHYIESNSAFARYQLEKSPEQQYGIHTFWERRKAHPALRESAYVSTLLSANPSGELNTYLGSPALAFEILKAHQTNYTFFDLEKEALDSIQEYFDDKRIPGSLTLRKEDSRKGIKTALKDLDKDAFIFFDPYDPFDPDEFQISLFDHFIDALKSGHRTLMWYGYASREGKVECLDKVRASFIRHSVDKTNHTIEAVSIDLKIIDQPNVKVNPGVLGCGLIAANLCAESFQALKSESKALEQIYRGAKLFDTVSGEIRAVVEQLY